MNTLLSSTLMLACGTIYPTVLCLQLLREASDLFIVKKWLSFFVISTMFQTVCYLTSKIVPVEVEFCVLIFMIMSDAKGSFLVYEYLNKMGISSCTYPLENAIRIITTCDSEDLIQTIDHYFTVCYKRFVFCKEDTIPKNDCETSPLSSCDTQPSLEPSETLDHTNPKSPTNHENHITENIEEIDDEHQRDKIADLEDTLNSSFEECEDEKNKKNKKRQKKTN